jgi:SulP family sulfate permease
MRRPSPRGGIPFILAVVFWIILLGGLLEALFGLVKLGTLIKFTPQPVMAGFQNAAAAWFLVQSGAVCGFDRNIPFTEVPQHLASIKPLSLVIAAITFATMWNARKILAKIPPILVAIAVGCALYYLCELIGLGDYLGPVIASASRPTMGLTAYVYFEGIARGGDFFAFVPTILGGALAHRSGSHRLLQGQQERLLGLLVEAEVYDGGCAQGYPRS